MQDGEPFLGFVNLQGTAFTDDVMATGMGTDLCLPVMRNALDKKVTNSSFHELLTNESSQGGKLTFEEAKQTIQQCIRLTYLRDCRAWPNYQIANVHGKCFAEHN